MIAQDHADIRRLLDQSEPAAKFVSELLTAYILIHRDFQDDDPLDRIRPWLAGLLREVPLDHLTASGRRDAELALRHLEGV